MCVEQVFGVAAVAGRRVARWHPQQQAAVDVGAPRQQPAPEAATLRSSRQECSASPARARRSAGRHPRSAAGPRAGAIRRRPSPRTAATRPGGRSGTRLCRRSPTRACWAGAAPAPRDRTPPGDRRPHPCRLASCRRRSSRRGRGCARRAHDTLNVLALVVRRQHDENLGRRRVARRDAHLVGAYRRNRTLTRSLNMSSEWRIAATLVGAECRHTTGTSAIRAPRFLARNSASGS